MFDFDRGKTNNRIVNNNRSEHVLLRRSNYQQRVIFKRIKRLVYTTSFTQATSSEVQRLLKIADFFSISVFESVLFENIGVFELNP